MKIFALYLPQFHSIKENDEWWGKGFTEWNNVKRAVPLFNGHVQPLHPLNNNYYNLLDKHTVEWQTSMMKDYGIDGFIYYHYYFNGHLLLETPAENLLKWNDIDQNFFFNWANHSWNRSWRGSKELLLEQTYGDRDDWKKHFNYLLPFFQDKRYEKINNKPVFMVYDSAFKEKEEMFDHFNSWCIEAGFNGIHIIEEHFSLHDTIVPSNNYTTNVYYTQPLVGKKLFLETNKARWYYHKIKNKLTQKGLIKSVDLYDANKLIKNYIAYMHNDDTIINGVFFRWDNTPRHGYRGSIIEPISKEVFFEYMDLIKSNSYIVINAWNEWAEGMVLEPTEEYGFQYLDWIKEWRNDNFGFVKKSE